MAGLPKGFGPLISGRRKSFSTPCLNRASAGEQAAFATIHIH
jgi:hypothetical protein